MLQLSKKIEYGLIALRHIASGRTSHTFTTKEIADEYGLSYDLLAKILQCLAKKGFLQSHHGVNGGYSLAKLADEITISSVIQAIEEKPLISIVQCESGDPENCLIRSTCTIRNPLVKIQGNINKMLEQVTIMEMV